jgi:hypothetical protein
MLLDVLHSISFSHILEGLIGYAIVHGLVKVIKFIGQQADERSKAIWRHYYFRAKGLGHRPDHVKNCSEGLCALI